MQAGRTLKTPEPYVELSPSRSPDSKPLGHAGANQFETRKDTEKSEGSRIHHNLVVNADIKGAVRTRLERDIDTKILSKHGRRPGGLDGGDSIHAALDRDFGHYITCSVRSANDTASVSGAATAKPVTR
jgi:hypothetical protein